MNEQEAVLTDAVEKINAGAALAHAIYFTKDIDWVRQMPTSVVKAYMRATDAYSTRKPRSTPPVED
jgi:hypothetical protein